MFYLAINQYILHMHCCVNEVLWLDLVHSAMLITTVSGDDIFALGRFVSYDLTFNYRQCNRLHLSQRCRCQYVDTRSNKAFCEYRMSKNNKMLSNQSSWLWFVISLVFTRIFRYLNWLQIFFYFWNSFKFLKILFCQMRIAFPEFVIFLLLRKLSWYGSSST